MSSDGEESSPPFQLEHINIDVDQLDESIKLKCEDDDDGDSPAHNNSRWTQLRELSPELITDARNPDSPDNYALDTEEQLIVSP